MNQFSLLESPLTGIHLIEASAGTGKTYAIEGLFLRLILEKRLSVGEILVVTYTNTATAELRERIRSRLRDCLMYLKGSNSKDPLLEAVVARQKNKDDAAMRLKIALQGFDEAAIYTIHGFCGRMLRESAFESRILFDTELITDQDEIVREVTEDFWRLNFYGESKLFLAYALEKINIDILLSLFGSYGKLPVDRIIPSSEPEDTKDLEIQYSENFKKMSDIWSTVRKEVDNILLKDEGLNRKRYPVKSVPSWIKEMDLFLWKDLASPFLFPAAEKFAAAHIKGSTKNNFPAPEHFFFNAWEGFMNLHASLENAFQRRVIALKKMFMEYAKKELRQRKASKNMAYYDDLLSDLHGALYCESGDRLALRIGERYRAALIDEFQDTDPIQYEIFRKVFWCEERTLFLIGDPKQAIYGFRGADIFTYMKAGSHFSSKDTLLENWRADPSLINAVNTIFGLVKNPFIYKQIPFAPAKAPGDKKQDSLIIDGIIEEPFFLWYLGDGTASGTINKFNKLNARTLIAGSVSSEIARLILLGRERRAMVGDRPLSEGDIAVLVRKNKEADLVKEALSAVGVPAVLHHTGSVFETREAEEIQRVLAAVNRPGNQRILKAALATDMMGIKAEDLDHEAGERWDSWAASFRYYREVWVSRGFMAMFRRILEEHQVIKRIAALSYGERRATNLLHIAELLQRASLERGRGIEGLLKWFGEKRQSETARSDEYQLRLESDEKAVQIVTVHRSKGLQYPVVFCPFMWDGISQGKKKDSHVIFHEGDHRLILDLGSEQIEENRLKAEKEAVAEELRLLYVAVTRACNRCYLVWTSKNLTPRSSLDLLLDGLEAEVEKFDGSSFFSRIKALGKRAKGSIRVQDMPAGSTLSVTYSKGRSSLSCRSFRGVADNYSRIASFTYLTGAPSRADSKDLDHAAADWESLATDEDNQLVTELPEEQTAQQVLQGLSFSSYPSEAYGFLDFPRGPAAGIFIHDLFESMDFQPEAEENRKSLVRQKLLDHGFQDFWGDTVCAMVERVLDAPLLDDVCGLRLSAIRRDSRKSEMEFYFPLNDISPGILAKTISPFTRSGIRSALNRANFEEGLPDDLPSRIKELGFHRVKGFMRGFIDLIFCFEGKYHIIDWKSNYLGAGPRAYGRQGLERTMAEHCYHLQYLLYVTALHQFLGFRVPGYEYEKHFGYVFYLFLRGMDPRMDPESGIYRCRPPLELVERLCGAMIPNT